MRLTEKGQVTIPKPIRDKLGIGPGSEVEFVDRGETVELVRSGETDARDRAARRAWIEAQLRSMHGLIDTGGLDGKAYVEMLRGPREDLDAD